MFRTLSGRLLPMALLAFALVLGRPVHACNYEVEYSRIGVEGGTARAWPYKVQDFLSVDVVCAAAVDLDGVSVSSPAEAEDDEHNAAGSRWMLYE